MTLQTEAFKKRGATRNRFTSLLFLAFAMCTACNSSSNLTNTNLTNTNPAKSSQDPAVVAAISRGKAIYQAHCIACHNSNPKMAGAVGPEIWGASQDLIQARVLHGTYPSDYKPKRKTKLMVPIPQLEADIPALHSYLNAP